MLIFTCPPCRYFIILHAALRLMLPLLYAISCCHCFSIISLLPFSPLFSLFRRRYVILIFSLPLHAADTLPCYADAIIAH